MNFSIIYLTIICSQGSVQLAALLSESPVHQLAVKIEPRGTLYLRLHHTSPHQTFCRKPKQPVIPRGKMQGTLFTVVIIFYLALQILFLIVITLIYYI